MTAAVGHIRSRLAATGIIRALVAACVKGCLVRAQETSRMETLMPAPPRIEAARRCRVAALLGALLVIALTMCAGASARALGVSPNGSGGA